MPLGTAARPAAPHRKRHRKSGPGWSPDAPNEARSGARPVTRPGGGQGFVIPTPRCRRCHDEQERHEPRVRATGSDGRFSGLQDRTVTSEPPGGCQLHTGRQVVLDFL